MERSPAEHSQVTGSNTRATRRDVVLLLLVGLLARFCFLPWVIGLPLAGDEEFYWTFAEKLDQSIDWLVLRPPLWGFVVAGLRATFGSPDAVRIACMLIGACTVPLVYCLGAQVVGRRAGFLAALMLAFYPEHIGFSHYLWAETALTFLMLLFSVLLFRFLENGRTRTLVVGALIAGITLLVKVFAIIPFIAFAITLLTRPIERKFRRLALAGFVFALPAAVYSGFASERVGRPVMLSETGLLSMRQAAGLDAPGGLDYKPAQRDKRRAELAAYWKARSVQDTVRDVRNQLFNMWSPQSFVSTRLIPASDGGPAATVPDRRAFRWRDRWRYEVPLAWGIRLSLLVSLAYLAVGLLGFAGLCLSDPSPFKLFGGLSLVGLSSTAVMAFATSRYRLSFLFLLMIFAAHALENRRALFAQLSNPRRSIPLILVLTVFARIILERNGDLGSWG